MHEADVGGHVQLGRRVPASLVERDHGVGAARDTATDVVEVKLHGTGVGARKHECGAGVARRADRAEHISVGITLILGLARPRPLLGPLIDQTVLLPDPHFVLEPDLDRHLRRYLLVGGRRRHPGCKVFLNASMACGSCLGCCGRGLTWAKPSSLRTRPIETSSRSTSKRSLMTRLRSLHRQRTTPSLARSGPASTIRFNSCFCSADSLGAGPGALPLTSPAGPFSLKRCAQSHNVCRSIAPISAAALRLFPLSTAASDSSRRA